MLPRLQSCILQDRVLFTRHAREEMESEEFGLITEQEVCDAVLQGRIIEDYKDDEPYPSCLVLGFTPKGRPLHVICACAEDSETAIVITVYQPNPGRWIDWEGRRK
jgi:hypothetical protein